MLMLSSADFFQNYFLENYLKTTIKSVKRFGSRLGRQNIFPDLGLNYLQMLPIISRRQKHMHLLGCIYGIFFSLVLI